MEVVVSEYLWRSRRCDSPLPFHYGLIWCLINCLSLFTELSNLQWGSVDESVVLSFVPVGNHTFTSNTSLKLFVSCIRKTLVLFLLSTAKHGTLHIIARVRSIESFPWHWEYRISHCHFTFIHVGIVFSAVLFDVEDETIVLNTFLHYVHSLVVREDEALVWYPVFYFPMVLKQ